MWTAWNLRYNRAYKLRQLAHQASDGVIQLGTANAAMVTRPYAPRHSDVWFRNQPPSTGEPIEYEKLEGYLNNLAHAAANKKAVLQKLSATAASITATNAMIVEEIKYLNANNKYLGGLTRSVTTAQLGKVKQKGRWTKENPGCFIVGGYCHMHGFCACMYHHSGLCITPVP